MNRLRCFITYVLLHSLLLPCAQPQNVMSRYWRSRFGSPNFEAREVEGLKEHIVDGKLHLLLPDFLALVLKNSPDVQLSRLDVYTAADSLVAARAPFNPVLTASFNAVRSVVPLGYGIAGSSSQFTLPDTINSLSQTSLIDYKQLLPTGQTFEATFNGNRSSGDSYAYPFLSGILNFQFTQPLLQGRTNLENLAPIRIAKSEIIITSKTSEANINQAMADAAGQYWNAVLARETINVQQQAVDLAKKSYDHDKLALDLGALSKLDILQSETQVAERRRDLVQAQYEYKVLLDGLRRLVGADLTPQMRDTDIVLDDDPSILPAKSSVLPFEQALAQALKSRPEITAAAEALHVDALNEKLNRDQLLPRIDLAAQGGSSGPGTNQLTPGGTVGLQSNIPPPGLGTTLQQVLNFKFPTYGGSLTITYPFHNSTAQAGLADALVSRARDRYRQRQVQEQITLDVRQSIHSIELADETIQAAITARDLARRNVDAEQQKYSLGGITAFELLDSQTRLANSEDAMVNAYINYQRAFVDYQRSTQTLMSAYGMQYAIPNTK